MDAKTDYPSACNAMETLIVDFHIAKEFLPLLAKELKTHNVELRGCKNTKSILNQVKQASELDWSTEYLDSISCSQKNLVVHFDVYIDILIHLL